MLIVVTRTLILQSNQHLSHDMHIVDNGQCHLDSHHLTLICTYTSGVGRILGKVGLKEVYLHVKFFRPRPLNH